MPYYPPAATPGVTSPVSTDPLTFSGALTFSKTPTILSAASHQLRFGGSGSAALGSHDGAGTANWYDGMQGMSQGANRLQVHAYAGIELRGARYDIAPATVARTATDPGVSVINATAGNKALVVKAAASQSVSIVEAQDSSANPLWAIDSAGLPNFAAAANAQTTVGAAGGASALPATPTKYFKVKDSAGTTLVIPAYAAS